jgi:hypothetical protein
MKNYQKVFDNVKESLNLKNKSNYDKELLMFVKLLYNLNVYSFNDLNYREIALLRIRFGIFNNGIIVPYENIPKIIPEIFIPIENKTSYDSYKRIKLIPTSSIRSYEIVDDSLNKIKEDIIYHVDFKMIPFLDYRINENMPVEALNLPFKITNLLIRSRIYCIKDLLNLNINDIENIRNIGTKYFDEIVKQVHLFGFLFNCELEEDIIKKA